MFQSILELQPRSSGGDGGSSEQVDPYNMNLMLLQISLIHSLPVVFLQSSLLFVVCCKDPSKSILQWFKPICAPSHVSKFAGPSQDCPGRHFGPSSRPVWFTWGESFRALIFVLQGIYMPNFQPVLQPTYADSFSHNRSQSGWRSGPLMSMYSCRSVYFSNIRQFQDSDTST